MSAARPSRWSPRLEQAEFSRLAWAFALSLAFHLVVFGGYKEGQQLHLWEHLHWPAWLQPPKFLAHLLQTKPQPRPLQPQEPPLIFVNVNPAQASAEPPKNAKYYSDKNAKAANPEPDKITEIPKITGTQTEVAKTEDVSRQKKYTPLQPARPAEKPQEAQPEVKPKPAYTPGDLTLAKPSPTPRKTEGTAEEAKPPRPRTIKQALAQLQDSGLLGERMKQDGGVRRHHEMATLDTRATPFGAYDAALIDAIANRWYSLLDAQNYASDSRGKVVLQFTLHADGRVSDMNMAENSAGYILGLMCQKAVLDPAPFAVWPSDMRRALGETRNIQFTFYYN